MAVSQNKVLYTALMKHDAGTIEKLVLMQYNTFQVKRKIILFLIAVAMIIYGVYTFSTGMITSYFCLFLGCVIIPGMNVRAKSNAKKIIAQLNNNFPSSQYYFSSTGFKDSEKSKEIPYRDLIRLIYDDRYLYLYISEEAAYMVNNASVFGENGLTGLKSLLSDKTGLNWKKPSTFWNFNIDSLRKLFGKKSDSFEGERLKDNHH